MKRLTLYVLLALFTFSCTSDLQETLTDNRDTYLDIMAQSDEYHNYFTALKETEAEREADPLDKKAAKAMYENGVDIRTLPETEITHIDGAITYQRTHKRLMQVINQMNARFPEYPNDMLAEDRIEMRQRYLAYRGMNPMDLVLANR